MMLLVQLVLAESDGAWILGILTLIEADLEWTFTVHTA